MTEEERMTNMQREMTRQITDELTATLGPVVQAAASTAANGSADTVARVHRSVRLLNTIIAGSTIAALAAGATFLFKMRDTIKDVEALPTDAEMLSAIETKAPWVRDKPFVMEKIKDIDASVEGIEEDVDQVKDSVRDIEIAQRAATRDILEAVRANNP